MKYNDIVFLSYKEENADINFTRLKDVVTHGGLIRSHGIKGIVKAHFEAAKKASTEWFYIVDGDNWIYDFGFDYDVKRKPKDSIFVWRSINPVNKLSYGYGGVKLLHRWTYIDRIKDFKLKSDLASTVAKNFFIVEETISETRFNTSEYAAWRSAFRECCKLAKNTDTESKRRLYAWQNKGDGNFVNYVFAGAKAGELFAKENEDISKINDFDWLKKEFDARITRA